MQPNQAKPRQQDLAEPVISLLDPMFLLNRKSSNLLLKKIQKLVIIAIVWAKEQMVEF